MCTCMEIKQHAPRSVTEEIKKEILFHLSYLARRLTRGTYCLPTNKDQE